MATSHRPQDTLSKRVKPLIRRSSGSTRRLPAQPPPPPRRAKEPSLRSSHDRCRLPRPPPPPPPSSGTSAPALPKQNHPNSRCQLVRGTMRLGLTYMRRRRGTRAPCHRVGPNVTPTAPYALYAARGGGPGGLTIIAILDLLGGAAQCMVAAGPMHGIQLPATDATKTSKCMVWGSVY